VVEYFRRPGSRRRWWRLWAKSARSTRGEGAARAIARC
jgi:hypothetical protein